jgi:hypothetical protein
MITFMLSESDGVPLNISLKVCLRSRPNRANSQSDGYCSLHSYCWSSAVSWIIVKNRVSVTFRVHASSHIHARLRMRAKRETMKKPSH